MVSEKPAPIRRKARLVRHKTVKPPTWRHLMHWSDVCLFIDSEPDRCIRIPCTAGPPMTAKLLQHMAQFKLVRHRISDCRWQLARNWESILQRLIAGLPQDDTVAPVADTSEKAPFVVDYGVDTMYVNVKAPAMPLALVEALAACKTLAQVDYKPVESPWAFGDSQLVMYPNGKGTGQTGGVSWGYILWNDLVEIRLRKTPLNDIVAAVRFLAYGLWTNGAKASLDLMQAAFRTMWGDDELYASVRYQLSQIHLCADIAHFPLTDRYLPNVVTRSIKRTVHLPSNEDLSLDDSVFDARTNYTDDDDWLYEGMAPPGWGDDVDDHDPADDFEEADEFPDEDDADDMDEDESDDDEEDEPVAQWHPEGGKIHWRGKAMEGMSFSPTGDISSAWYDKILEERKSKKAWMREIHKAGKWEPGMRLTRVEMRYRRPILNELEVAYGTEKGARYYDDPAVALDHLGEMWGFGVGYPPEFDRLPDVTQQGWMRLAVADANDATRSRWETDPLWEVVQRVPFAQGLPKPLKRAKQAKPDLEKMDAEIRGMLVSLAMLRGSYLKAPASLLQEVSAFMERIVQWDAARGVNFAEDVRERARMSGKKLPVKAPLELPKRPRGRPRKIRLDESAS